MIIRNLRENEYTKSSKVISSAYSFKWTKEDEKRIFVPEYCFGAFEDDDETLMSLIYSVSLCSRYFGEYIPSAGAGMIATLPMYRRQGCVRALFNAVFQNMKEKGEVFSYLYPFSYDYYRKFGYEQIAEKYILTFPMQALFCIPANTDGALLDDGANFCDVVRIYNEYTQNLQAAFERTPAMWDKKLTLDPYSADIHTYLWHNEKGENKAYATLRLEGTLLNVLDMAYCGSVGLRGILGFLRQFYGRALNVRFANVTRESPLRYMIKEFSNSQGTLSSWAMARVVDVKKALELALYPQDSGSFSVKVEDFLPWNNKIFQVEYFHGKCQITERENGAYDLKLGIPLLTRLFLGSDTFTPGVLSYCDCEVKGNLDDLLKVFHRREIYLNDSAI